MDLSQITFQDFIVELAAVITVIGFYFKIRAEKKQDQAKAQERAERETERRTKTNHTLQDHDRRIKRLEDKDIVIFKKIDDLQNELHGVANSLSRIEGYIRAQETETK